MTQFKKKIIFSKFCTQLRFGVHSALSTLCIHKNVFYFNNHLGYSNTGFKFGKTFVTSSIQTDQKKRISILTSSSSSETNQVLNCAISYDELTDLVKGTQKIQNLVCEAENDGYSVVSIEILNKKTLPLAKNAGRLAFVTNGQFIEDIPARKYNHKVYGQGVLYPSIVDALKANNFDKTKYYRKKIYPVYQVSLQELDVNPFNPFLKLEKNFPKAILNGSLIADGSLKLKKKHCCFTIGQTASLSNDKIEHITYLLYIFSKIPPEFFGDKALFLYQKKNQKLWL